MKIREIGLKVKSGSDVLIYRDELGYYSVIASGKLTLSDWKEIVYEMELIEQIPSDM